MRFGEAVQVEYVDLADPEQQLEFSDLVTMAEEGNVPYPLVAINGRVTLAGSAHYYNVLPHVEELLQQKDPTPQAR
jgi:disulfide oxidoreductase YuzD